MERTLAIVKPDAVANGHTGAILDAILKAGFAVKALKLTRLTRAEAEGFYAVHKERPFFGELVDFMASGPCVPMVLEKDGAVQAWRDLIGATDPAEAAEGTVRARFAESKGRNAAHGSDSVENGRTEAHFFFSEAEILAIAG